jgi:hypothetical protein
MKVLFVTSLLAEALGLPLQQYWRVRLRKKNDSKCHNGERPYSLQIFGPAPTEVVVNNQRGSDEWALFSISYACF